MKKYIFIILILFYFPIQISAKEVQVFFITEGGSTNTNGFKIIDDYVNKTDGTYCATYKSNGTIKTLNSINGASFSIYKSGTNLVSGKEWYTYNYSNNKLYYFNQSKSYNVDELLQKLSMRGDPYPVISLFAHWKGDGLDDGIDIGGTANKNGSSTNNKNIKVKSISLSGSSKITKGKSTSLKVTIKPSNAKKETITWSSSNKKIASVNSSGKVTGLSKGTATINAKTNSGKKATFKVTIVEEKVHKVKISFDMNGGKLSSTHAETLSSSGSNVIRVKENSKIVQTVAFGSKTSSSGLPNYNNPNFLNIEKIGYIAKKGAEWNTKPDGSGKSYSDKKVYKASEFCNAKDKDCNVTLYVNWEKKQPVTINLATFNIGAFSCGSSSNNCTLTKKAFTNLIKKNRIDIIGLQEAREKGSTKEQTNKTIREIGANTSLENYFITTPYNVNAILSKYKFKDKKNIGLNTCESDGKQVENRAIEKVIININGIDISYYNTHLDYHNNCAAEHMKQLSEIVKNDKNPIIITGDYNDISGKNYEQYLKPLGFKVAAHDAKLHGKEGKNSYMDSVYILSKGHIEIVSSKTIITYAKYSDHNLIISKLNIY